MSNRNRKRNVNLFLISVVILSNIGEKVFYKLRFADHLSLHVHCILSNNLYCYNTSVINSLTLIYYSESLIKFQIIKEVIIICSILLHYVCCNRTLLASKQIYLLYSLYFGEFMKRLILVFEFYNYLQKQIFSCENICHYRKQ